MDRRVPEHVHALFWDVDPTTIDLDRHADYVIERTMSRGDWAAMRWLRTAYARETLARFLEAKGHRLAPRDRAYWALWSGVDVSLEAGGGRPPWARPRPTS